MRGTLRVSSRRVAQMGAAALLCATPATLHIPQGESVPAVKFSDACAQSGTCLYKPDWACATPSGWVEDYCSKEYHDDCSWDSE